jgi:phosphatidylinositol-4-phosphate 3-kinase
LNDIALNVQKTKESHRLNLLHNALENIHQNLKSNPTSLPLSPTLQVAGIYVRTCAYFPSNTLPLKINFLANDGSTIPAIYKVSDMIFYSFLSLLNFHLFD